MGTMIESGLFSEALDSIRDTLSPGLLPPAAFLVSLLEHALQVPHAHTHTHTHTQFTAWLKAIGYQEKGLLLLVADEKGPPNTFQC